MSSYESVSHVPVGGGGSSVNGAPSVWQSVGSYFRPSSQGLSDLTAYVSSGVTHLAQHSTDALKAVTTPARRRCVLYKNFTSWRFGASRYTLLLVGLVDGFQILEVASTKQVRVWAAYSDAPQMQGSYQQQDEATLLNQTAAASTPIGMIKLLTHHSTFADRSATTTAAATSTTASSSPSHPPPSSSSTPSTPYFGALLAVCSAEDRSHFPRSMLKIYSLALGRYVHMLRFRSRIFGVEVQQESRYMVVVLENELYVYTTPSDGYSLQFECIWSTRILPNPSPHILQALTTTLGPSSTHTASLLATSTFSKDEWSVAATSHRWVAYCPSEPLAPGVHPAAYYPDDPAAIMHEPATLSSSGSSESLSTVAKGFASGLYNLGGMGKLAVANYLSGDAEAGVGSKGGVAGVVAPVVQAAPSILGTVVVRDLVTQRLIASIKAHPNTQVTHIVFDRSGTLLATVPVDGQYVHIYSIAQLPDPIAPSAQGVSLAPSHLASSAMAGVSSVTNSPVIQGRRGSVQGDATSPASSSVHLPPPPLPTYQTRFLYRLHRGITHACIQSVRFSLDSKYVAVVSDKGTTHLFAIHPVLGGEVSVQTHGPVDLVDENSLVQQMVAKVSVLKMQQQQATSAEHPQQQTQSEYTAAAALNGFLYQPKVLTAIHRIKSTGVPTAWAQGQQAHAAPAFMNVVAMWDRLEAPIFGGGAVTPQQQGETSVPHHLIISTWNDELQTFALTTRCSHTPASTPGSSMASVDKDVDSARRLKLVLHVDTLAEHDLHPGLQANATNAAGAMQQQGFNASRRGSQQPLHQQQPHQFADNANGEEPPMVRILTQRGQEDDQTGNTMQQQPHQQHYSPLPQSRGVPPPQQERNFFQQLEADVLYGLANRSSPFLSPSSAPINILPRATNVQSASPILASINHSTAASSKESNSPLLPSSAAAEALGSKWLSEVELRSYQSSSVPLWASPQFSLLTYTHPSLASSAHLYVERAGKREMAYEKFARWEGLRVVNDETTAGGAKGGEGLTKEMAKATGATVGPSSSASSSSSSAASAKSSTSSDTMLDLITSAMSSSIVLNDVSFSERLRTAHSSSPSFGHSHPAHPHHQQHPGSIDFNEDAFPGFGGTDEPAEGHASMIFGTAGGTGAPGGLNGSQLINSIDESYYPRSTDDDSISSQAQANGGESSILQPTKQRMDHTVTSSTLFTRDSMGASEILTARLAAPSTNVEDSILFSTTLPPPASDSTSPPLEAGETKPAKKKKKAKGGH